MREAARKDDHVGALQVGVLVPDVLGVLAEHVLGGVVRVLVAVAAREYDDGKFHDVRASYCVRGAYPHPPAASRSFARRGGSQRLAASVNFNSLGLDDR